MFQKILTAIAVTTVTCTFAATTNAQNFKPVPLGRVMQEDARRMRGWQEAHGAPSHRTNTGSKLSNRGFPVNPTPRHRRPSRRLVRYTTTFTFGDAQQVAAALVRSGYRVAPISQRSWLSRNRFGVARRVILFDVYYYQ